MVNRMAPIEGTNWTGHDLELFPLLTRRLLGLAVWYGLNVATLVASYALNIAVWKSKPLLPTPRSTGLKLMHTRKNRFKNPEIQPSAILKVNYTKSSELLCLLLLIHDGQLAAGCLN